MLTTDTVRETLYALGVTVPLSEPDTTPIMSVFRLSSGDTYERIHDELKALGFVIYAGRADLRKSIFRIAPMGAMGDDDPERLVAGLRSVFRGDHG